ncbi:hypothetical protein B0H14DRAFT_3546715 [Mycena olivaceomarginata]|nr:hypothetical protein B0H14DRAFT_3546715 [Mycena olivaceomarginata]
MAITETQKSRTIRARDKNPPAPSNPRAKPGPKPKNGPRTAARLKEMNDDRTSRTTTGPRVDTIGDAPLWKFHEHTAAVKALAWDPHLSQVLASGGGPGQAHSVLEHDQRYHAQRAGHWEPGVQPSMVPNVA